MVSAVGVMRGGGWQAGSASRARVGAGTALADSNKRNDSNKKKSSVSNALKKKVAGLNIRPLKLLIVNIVYVIIVSVKAFDDHAPKPEMKHHETL